MARNLCLSLALAAAAASPGAAAEFRLALAAPASIHPNSLFEVEVSLTSSGIPEGAPGAVGWTIGVAHSGVELVSVTTKGTAVDGLYSGGFQNTQVTVATASRPENDGFVSAVLLSTDLQSTLPPSGTSTIARAVYRAGPSACSGARIAFADGLRGTGEAISIIVILGSSSIIPALGPAAAWSSCTPDSYALRLAGASRPLRIEQPLGEERIVPIAVRLEQIVPAASAWTLAVSHDAATFSLVDVGLEGTGLGALFDPPGFAAFEITSGPGNEGFTARVQVDPEARLLPAPDAAIAIARYRLAPALDPGSVGAVAAAAFRFAASLRDSSGDVRNTVAPAGTLSMEDLPAEVTVVPATRFIRGDADGDGEVSLADAVAILFHVFAGAEAGCAEAASAGDGAGTPIALADAIAVLGLLFLDGPALPPPFPGCGSDPTFPSRGCARTACR